MEFQHLFTAPLAVNNAYVDIQAGAGGTEAQDWAAMLKRMYLGWATKNRFQTTLLDLMPGDTAGIKSVSIKVVGPYAFGWLQSETGVHRLVRKSPFDSGHRRHTSFASVFVSAELDNEIKIKLNSDELRIDTFRASGAGGQHVNKTDSAIRITHLPTNIVVQSQSARSQHQNRAEALKRLQAKLYELAEQAQHAQQQQLAEAKTDIGWGHQIRSYVLDQSRIKDLRTGLERTDTQVVLDGDLNGFIKATLKAKRVMRHTVG